MSLSLDQVRHVARLSRLALTEAEIEEMTRNLCDILEYVWKINELDTNGVEPLAHALTQSNVFREDELRQSLPRDVALANAPAESEGCFKVPRIIEPQ